MSQLVVPHGLLRQSAEQVRSCAADMTIARKDLERRADELLAGGWSGEAATIFGQGMREWEQGAAEVMDALADMATLLDEADRDFRLEDARQRGAIRSAAAGLGDAAVTTYPSGLRL